MQSKEQSFLLPFPPQVNDFDTISPFKITVVILVKEFLRNRDSNEIPDDDTNGEEEKFLVPSVVYSAEYRRSFYTLLLKLVQMPDLSYKDLYFLLSKGPNKLSQTHLDGFNELMSIATKVGIEILFKLSKTMEKMITETSMTGNNACIHQSSIIGLVLRRIFISIERMSFQEVMELYKHLCTYYDKGRRAFEISAPTKLENLGKIRDFEFSKNKWSSKQAEIFINQQISLLENDETNAMNPKELQEKIEEIARIYNPLHAKTYYLSYLNNLRVRDLPNCIEALHRTFDRNAEKYAQNSSQESVSKSNFQYSLLNLAILHTLFEHNEEAMKCLKECIMIAQENGDRVCLQLAQLWMCLLDNSHFHLSEKTIWNKTEMTLVRSVSHNIQSLVKVAALSGYLPSKLFDVLIKSDILNWQYSMVNLISNCVVERSALWILYGKNEMATLFGQLLLNSTLRTMERTQHSGEGQCIALCNLATWLSLQGDFVVSSILLQKAKSKFPRNTIARNWMLTELYISSQQSIYLEKWSEAAIYCDQLYHIDKHLSLLQRSNLQLARGNRHVAATLLETLLDAKDQIEDQIKVRAMVMQAQVLYDSHNQVSSESLLILNRAVVLAKEKHLDYEHSIVQMNIAFILYKMNMKKQSLSILRSVIENILANGGIYDKARVIFLFNQCLIDSATTKQIKFEYLTKLQGQFDKVIGYFTKLGCWHKIKDVYAYLAQVWHELGHIQERNHFALKFRLTAEERTNNEHLGVFH